MFFPEAELLLTPMNKPMTVAAVPTPVVESPAMTSAVSGDRPQRATGSWLKRALWRLTFISLLVVAFIAGGVATCYFTRGERVVVPNVVGKTEREARELLEKSGLRVVVIDVPNAPEPVGTVTRQNPRAGSIVRKPFPVKINVSRAQ